MLNALAALSPAPGYPFPAGRFSPSESHNGPTMISSCQRTRPIRRRRRACAMPLGRAGRYLSAVALAALATGLGAQTTDSSAASDVIVRGEVAARVDSFLTR